MYTNIGDGGNVVESTYDVVYDDAGPNDASNYVPRIEPTLPIPVNDFKYHVSSCHAKNEKFSKQYKVLIHTLFFCHS